MDVARSSFYDAAGAEIPYETALVARMQAVQDEYPAYGYRRIAAELRAQGTLANHKRVARLMRLHGMQVRPRRRYVATTDSNHDGPIFPNLARDLKPDGPISCGSRTSPSWRSRPGSSISPSSSMPGRVEWWATRSVARWRRDSQWPRHRRGDGDPQHRDRHMAS